jgi:hypothetical protein
MNLKIGRRFRDLSIETKMLAIILPLVAIPMILLGTVGYLHPRVRPRRAALATLPSGEAIFT